MGVKIPQVIDTEQQKALLGQPNKRYTSGLRNLAIMRLMLDTGLRSGEVQALKVGHIDWKTGRLHVHQGKGSKDRVLWASKALLKLLREWREKRQDLETDDDGFLFVTSRGEQLSTRYLRQMVKRYAVKAGLPEWVHPHTLRHTFATDLYRETNNIRMVQKALGHKDLSTTMIYTHIVDSELEGALRALRQGA